jgi:xanthine dehydrogenase accessory factor
MRDLKAIVSSARSAVQRPGADRLLLATVVNVVGSAYRRIGARMLIADDRWMSGSVSGGCLEGDVVRRAWWCTRDGRPALLSYDSTDDEIGWGTGLGCNGLIDLLLQPCGGTDPLDPLSFFGRCLAAEKPGALATVFRSSNDRTAVGAQVQIDPDGTLRSTVGDPAVGEALTAGARAALHDGRAEVYSGGGVEALLEAIVPPPHLALFGAGPDAVPVASLAGALGWVVTVCDLAGRARTRGRFSGADQVLLGQAAGDWSGRLGDDGRGVFAVVMSHHYEHDRDTLGALLRSRARYIGVLGPKRRTGRMLSELGMSADERLHAPIGLDLGSETPFEIALAITAEIQATATGATAGQLRNRAGLIHEPPVEKDSRVLALVGR